MRVDFHEWDPLYRSIVAEFGFDPAKDAAAARELAVRLSLPPFAPEQAWQDLERMLGGRPAVVLGAGDDAARALSKAPRDHRVIAADGATTAALEVGVRPHLIVTDLDGIVEHEVEAARRGSFVAIHAHGDNRVAVGHWLDRFPPQKVVGTCQCETLPPLRNYGGFTDGDRAAFIADGLGARGLLLLGFDFSGAVGRYTGAFDPATKPRKLGWSRRLLQELSSRGAQIRFG